MNIRYCSSTLWALCAPLLAAGAIALAAGILPVPASADAPTSATISTLYSFGVPHVNDPGWAIGSTPHGLAAAPGGALVGLTQAGGTGGVGTIVQFGAGGTNPSALYTFGSSPSPDSSLLPGAGGILYQTDPDGGANASGALHSLAPGGSQLTLLYSFTASDPNTGVNADGGYPIGPLLQGSDGTLYGETLLGGSDGSGVIYKIHADGSGFAVLHDFGSGTDGVSPVGGLITGPGGFLYGVTEYGGSGDNGTVFKIAPNGSGYTVLYQFTAADPNTGANTDGAAPVAALTLGSDGLLYGVASAGGPSGEGTVFQLSTSGANFSALYAFSAINGANANQDGAMPSAPLVKDAEGNFYGTTASGGTSGKGTLFLVTAGGILFNTLYSLGSGDGTNPVLTMGTDGVLYGLTADGGANGFGCLFQVDLYRPATHVLWTNTNGQVSVWNLSDPNPAATCQVFGSFPGWTAKAIAEGPDGNVRLLWTNTDGRISVWNLADANPSATCLIYGPYSGWTAKSLAVGPDNAAHLLWDNAGGPVSLWNLTDANPASSCLIYGPYSGWFGTAISIGPDNHERLLWNNTDGRVSLWNLVDAQPDQTCQVFGPYSGWSGKALAVGPDNAAHLLWDNAGGPVSLWNLTDASPASSCLIYGPYSGWAGSAIAIGPDNHERLLWNNTSRQASLWNLSDPNPAASCLIGGPYGGWTATGISAAP